jgi:hypothetical protein
MATKDPTPMLIIRAYKAASESQTLLEEADTLLSQRADLLEQQRRLLSEILASGRHMCDTAAETVAARY